MQFQLNIDLDVPSFIVEYSPLAYLKLSSINELHSTVAYRVLGHVNKWQWFCLYTSAVHGENENNIVIKTFIARQRIGKHILAEA
jgi:hypothetical protein